MTIFDSIRYQLPVANSTDFADQNQILNRIPWHIRCIWYDHEDFQYAKNGNKIFHFTKHNVNLLRKIILEYEDDNI